MHPDKDVDPPATRGSWSFLLLLGLLAGLVALVYFSRPTGPQDVGVNHPAVGSRLSQLEVEPLLNTQQRVTLNDLQGKVALINFWGPWCPPCLQELPELLELEKKYRGRDNVQVVLVSSWGGRGDSLEDLRDDTEKVLKKYRADPAIYEDEDGTTIEALMASAGLQNFGFPTTVLLDGQGVVRGLWPYYDPAFVSQMDRAMDSLATEAK